MSKTNCDPLNSTIDLFDLISNLYTYIRQIMNEAEITRSSYCFSYILFDVM